MALGAAFAAWLVVGLPRGPHADGPPAPTLATPPAADRCAARLELAGARPAPRREGLDDELRERVWLFNGEPEPLRTAGFTLVAGRSRRLVPDLVLEPGEVMAVDGLRLRDRDGEVVLVDPCGVRLARLAWDAPERGRIVGPPERHVPLPERPDRCQAGAPCEPPWRHPDTRAIVRSSAFAPSSPTRGAAPW